MRGQEGRVRSWRIPSVRQAIAWSVARSAGPMSVITRSTDRCRDAHRSWLRAARTGRRSLRARRRRARMSGAV